MDNCFTFSPLGGFSLGIELATGVPTGRNNGSVYRDHVRVGPDFIQVDSVKKPIWTGNILRAAKMRRVDTQHASFEVFSRLDDGASLLVFIDLSLVPAGMARRIDPSSVNAWVNFQTDADVVLQHNSSGKCLVEFTRDEQAMLIFDRDGAVYRIVRRNGRMIVDKLTKVQMAKERCRLMRDQIDRIDPENADIAMRHLHGILGGAVRLLQAAVRASDTREVFVDFLADYADGRMSDSMRQQVYDLLRAYSDTRAFMFSEGYDGNVVLLAGHRNVGQSAEAKKKKAERSARDSATRNQMRGASSGGKQTRKK